jgi:D-alanyl-D-alanine carboxypeptidase (penicillin-binding protein 5/6)
LDGPGQVTSAYDLALIARACFARDDFRKYTGSKTAQIPAQPPKDKHGFQIQNDNSLLFEYEGAIGGKTGFTDIARHTYVGAATREGRTLVVTMLGGEHQPGRLWQQGAKLLDWGFSTTGEDPVGQLVQPGETEATPTPTPSLAGQEAALAAGGTNAGSGVKGQALGLAGAGLAAIFVFAWVVLLLVGRRKRRREAR